MIRTSHNAQIPLSAGRSTPTNHSIRVADELVCVRRLHVRHLRVLYSQEGRVRTEIDAGTVPDETRALIDRQALDTNERLKQLFVRRS